MNRTYRVWYVLVLTGSLALPGVRLLLHARAPASGIDPAMAQSGQSLFTHEWKPHDPLCSAGDGIGPVYNATSCAACHHLGGTGGAGGLEHNVTSFTVRLPGGKSREGIVHAQAVGRVETLRDIHPGLPAISRPSLAQITSVPGGSARTVSIPADVTLSQLNTPALFGARLIDLIPEQAILANARLQQLRWGLAPSTGQDAPVGRIRRVAEGRVGRFGWKAQMASLDEFVRAACASELGLSNPGQRQPQPLYASNAVDPSPGFDLTEQQCRELTAFCLSLPRPVERLPRGCCAEQAAAGKKVFHNVGCAECHTPKLGEVEGIYSDLLLHRMSEDLVGGGSYGEPSLPDPDSPGEDPLPSEWRTPPLWGVADSAPYLHDGRAATLEEAIRLHGGQGTRAAQRFAALPQEQQAQLIVFLKTLRAP